MPPEPSDTTGGRPFFGRVESLRGLGALAVAGFHFTGCDVNGVGLLRVPWAGAGPVQNAIGRVGLVLLPGHAALMTFFVISGFVLRVSLGHGPQTVPAAFARFLLARVFRIYPIVAVGMIVAAVLAAVGVFGEAPTAGQIVANFLLLDVSLNPHLWALQVEMLMVPVILALYFLERRCGPAPVAAVALVTTGLVFVPTWAVWPAVSVNLFAFALGMVLPTYGRRFAAGLSGRAAVLVVAGAVATLLAAGPCLGTYSWYAAIIEAYAGTALVSLVAYRTDLRLLRLLDAGWLRRLGSAAGSYYVLHMVTIPPAMAVAAAVVPPAWSGRAPGVVGVAWMAVWLAALAPLMIGFFLLVEAPGIALGRRLARALGLDPRVRQTISSKVPGRRAA